MLLNPFYHMLKKVCLSDKALRYSISTILGNSQSMGLLDFVLSDVCGLGFLKQIF